MFVFFLINNHEFVHTHPLCALWSDFIMMTCIQGIGWFNLTLWTWNKDSHAFHITMHLHIPKESSSTTVSNSVDLVQIWDATFVQTLRWSWWWWQKKFSTVSQLHGNQEKGEKKSNRKREEKVYHLIIKYICVPFMHLSSSDKFK